MSSTSRDGLLALCGSLLGLSVITLGLRFHSRKQQRLRLLADDWTVLLGVIAYLGTCIVIFLYVRRKWLGYSSGDFTPEENAAAAEPKTLLATSFNLINTTTLALIKISALFFYRRAFQTSAFPADWFSISIVALIIIVGCWYITFEFLAAFQCRGHFSAAWQAESVAEKYCTLNIPWAMGLAISDFLLDLIILVIPIPRIWRLHMDLAKRLSLIGLFSLASVGLGASIARIIIYSKTLNAGLDYFLTHDLERANTQLIYIQMLESGISIVAVNLPSLWQMFTSTIPMQLARGMQSLRSLQSMAGSHSQRGRKSSEAETVVYSQDKSAATGSPQSTQVREIESQTPQ